MNKYLIRTTINNPEYTRESRDRIVESNTAENALIRLLYPYGLMRYARYDVYELNHVIDKKQGSEIVEKVKEMIKSDEDYKREKEKTEKEKQERALYRKLKAKYDNL